MKKKLFALLLVVSLLAFAGCSGGENGNPDAPAQPTAQTVPDNDNILKIMESMNDLDTLMEKYGKITIQINSGGIEGSVHLELKEDGYYYYGVDSTGVENAITPKGQYAITSDGSGTYYLHQAEEVSVIQDDLVEMMRQNMYQYNAEETLEAVTDENGKTTAKTATHMSPDKANYSEFKELWGIEDEEFDFCKEYLLDSETMEILEVYSYCELSTGQFEIGKIGYQYGQDYVISDALQNYMNNAK